MTKTELLEMISATLGVPAIPDDAEMGKLRGWDSFGQVSLVLALEQHAAVSVPPDLFGELTSVAAILDFLDEEGVFEGAR